MIGQKNPYRESRKIYMLQVVGIVINGILPAFSLRLKECTRRENFSILNFHFP